MRHAVLISLFICSMAQTMLAQSTATQLPLSGRGSNSGAATATQSPIPGTTASVDTINTSVQASGPFSGSARSTGALSGKLSFADAIQRGLQYNLGTVGLNAALRQASGLQRVARSALLPNLNSSLNETVQQTNLRAMGIRINVPIRGFAFPTVVGPFNYFDLRARLTQNLADLTAIDNYRSSRELVKANQASLRDARDMVVLAVGGAYLQVIAAKARIESAQAQLATAQAQYKQASEQRAAGVLALTDLNRTEIQVLTTKERVASLNNDYDKQKINLARLTGLPPNDNYEITTDVPFAPAPELPLDDAIKQAFSQRPDLVAAQAQIKAAELTLSAAHAERLPSLSLSADYGVIGTNPSQAHGTFSVAGSLKVPIWQGGRTGGDIEQASAALEERKAELEDLRSHVEADIRDAYLDLDAAATQVEVAHRNLEVTRQTLDLTRQRLDAGVTDYVEVTQAQESVAQAELDLINSTFSHNVAKLSLARALGYASDKVPAFLRLQ